MDCQNGQNKITTKLKKGKLMRFSLLDLLHNCIYLLKSLIFSSKVCYAKGLFFIIFSSSLNAHINLEENPDSFILESKQIILKDYPEAFNASLTRWNGQLILSFRIIPDKFFSFNSKIGIAILNEDFEVIGEPQILDTRNKYSLVPSRAEDARLLTVGDKLYMVYGDNKEDFITRGGFRVYVSELTYEEQCFIIKGTSCLKDFEGENPDLREKNWVPFDYHGELLLSYSLAPHVIFQPLLRKEKCLTLSKNHQNIFWDYGELRGGSPALLDGDHYISFFHSSIDMLTAHSNNRKISHYFMGAYTFSKEPPFEITKISDKPIVGKGFYSPPYYKPYWKSVRCVFPCGLLIENNIIYVSCGRQDHEIIIVKLDKEKLIKSLSDVR